MEGNRTVIAHVRVNHIVYKGEARCHPQDRFNLNIGQRLAAGRALANAGRVLTSVANAAVDAKSNMHWCQCDICVSSDSFDGWNTAKWARDIGLDS
jgi:hypothetical protein